VTAHSESGDRPSTISTGEPTPAVGEQPDVISTPEAPAAKGQVARTTAAPSENDPAETAEVIPGLGPSASNDDQQKQSSDSKKRVRPETIAELIEYAYREAGRKLNLTRDLKHLTLEQDSAQAEVDLIRRLAADDPFLAVPQSLLAAVAEVQTKSQVQGRILELVLAAFASHKLFEGVLLRLADPKADPPLTAYEISSIAKTFTFETVNSEEVPERKTSMRDRVRVNAITGFELFRVLRDGWTTDQFIQDMSALVWDNPIQRSAPRMAALLATAKNNDALSQISRHFEQLLLNAQTQASAAHRRANELEHRANSAESENRALTTRLDAERSHTSDLQTQAHHLAQQLAAERNSRRVDKSHLVDDYEALRTQIIRKLSSQVDLLGDALYAIRSGEKAVAEEFVDRALRKIDGEAKRLRALEEGEE
jgi:hypothetical protein